MKNATHREDLLRRVQDKVFSSALRGVLGSSDESPVSRSSFQALLLALRNISGSRDDSEQASTAKRRLKGPFERAVDRIFDAEDATFKEMRQRWERIVNPDGQG